MMKLANIKIGKKIALALFPPSMMSPVNDGNGNCVATAAPSVPSPLPGRMTTMLPKKQVASTSGCPSLLKSPAAR
jgi:hypothetical protein